MSKKEQDSLKISQRLLTAFNEEYEKFCKWSKTKMTRTEFLEFAILQAKHKRVNHRAQWQFYSISPKKIGILDRRNKEKISVSRVHDYLFCKKDNDLFCNHCVYCLIDKDVKKSLNENRPRFMPMMAHRTCSSSQLTTAVFVASDAIFTYRS